MSCFVTKPEPPAIPQQASLIAAVHFLKIKALLLNNFQAMLIKNPTGFAISSQQQQETLRDVSLFSCVMNNSGILFSLNREVR